jgi:hypothetical protein
VFGFRLGFGGLGFGKEVEVEVEDRWRFRKDRAFGEQEIPPGRRVLR